LFCKPLRAVRGTSIATASAPKISCLTVPWMALAADFMAALAPGLKLTMTRVVSAGAALAGLQARAAAAARMQRLNALDARVFR